VRIMAIVAVLSGYLIGSVPFAFLLARHRRQVDIRKVGSGNVGAANVLRVTGAAVAGAVVALDVVKGAAAVLLAARLGAGETATAVSGVAAIVGHVYPVWLGFAGGKGVATACGVFAVQAPLATGAAALIWLATVWLTRYVSLGSIVAISLFAPLAYATEGSRAVILSAIAGATIIVPRHRSNVSRLMSGTERKLGDRAP
jgi:acyl phosphate:glycerol-3-phosphate acyltransferase